MVNGEKGDHKNTRIKGFFRRNWHKLNAYFKGNQEVASKSDPSDKEEEEKEERLDTNTALNRKMGEDDLDNNK